MSRTNPTRWLTLFDGSSLGKWAISADGMEIDGDTLVFSGKAAKAEVGGMSWDNYVLGADVMITPRTAKPRFCVQLTASGTCIYCQLMPWHIRIAYYCARPKKHPAGFTHLITPVPVTPRARKWLAFQMRAENGRLTALLDGKKVAAANIPDGTAGMPGFLINQQKDCVVRLRNIRIKFLRPTRKQMLELARDAQINWLRYEESQRRR
ncbi:MAG: family 16 glycoside hydrolase [Verrucomicrobiota bacterium]